ncbi:hypothetical protein GCM10010415_75140 [Streptomyces atrovirens]
MPGDLAWEEPDGVLAVSRDVPGVRPRGTRETTDAPLYTAPRQGRSVERVTGTTPHQRTPDAATYGDLR